MAHFVEFVTRVPVSLVQVRKRDVDVQILTVSDGIKQMGCEWVLSSPRRSLALRVVGDELVDFYTKISLVGLSSCA